MGWTLRWKDDEGMVYRLRLSPDSPVLVGRGPDCQVQLPSANVSRRHCQLQWEEGAWTVVDLGSQNGTRVNGAKVDRARLHDCDAVTLGSVTINVQVTVEAGQEPGHDSFHMGLSVEDLEDVGEGGIATLADDPRLPKRLFGNRFQLEAPIHEGSSGRFFRARDVKRDRPACVKLMAYDVAIDESQRFRFVRGIRTAAQLRHPNIVEIYQGGRSGEQWWLAMELMEGPSLRKLAAQAGVGNVLPPERVHRIALDMAAALEASFERQILFRNIKPDNVLLDAEGVAKLGNFMLARDVELNPLDQVTRRGELVGDLAYLAPECARSTGAVDCRSDLYALGACLYALMTGQPLFTGAGRVELVERIVNEAPVLPSLLNPATPEWLEGIVLKCLAKNPTDRYATPAELSAELRSAGSDQEPQQ